jgi:DNA-3-methyladenine glycosylase I
MRCPWCKNDSLYIKYHDEEWGVPVYNDNIMFEFLILEGFQAGLSWKTILYKRNNFRNAFNNFNPYKIARYNKRKINSLMKNSGIIRNELKITSAIQNAKAFLNLIDKGISFSDYIWQFTDGKIIKNKWKHIKQVPSKTKLSDQMSKKLKHDGFKFVGSTICYAHMQVTGLVNDHLINCFRYNEL